MKMSLVTFLLMSLYFQSASPLLHSAHALKRIPAKPNPSAFVFYRLVICCWLQQPGLLSYGVHCSTRIALCCRIAQRAGPGMSNPSDCKKRKQIWRGSATVKNWSCVGVLSQSHNSEHIDSCRKLFTL